MLYVVITQTYLHSNEKENHSRSIVSSKRDIWRLHILAKKLYFGIISITAYEKCITYLKAREVEKIPLSFFRKWDNLKLRAEQRDHENGRTLTDPLLIMKLTEQRKEIMRTDNVDQSLISCHSSCFSV